MPSSYKIFCFIQSLDVSFRRISTHINRWMNNDLEFNGEEVFPNIDFVTGVWNNLSVFNVDCEGLQ